MNKVVSKSVPVTRTEFKRLMAYHDQQFVEVAYRLLLGRPIDHEGQRHHVGELRSGTSRREIAYRLASSKEGQSNGVDLRLFRSYLLWRRVEQVPVLGTFCLFLLCLFRFKSLVREFRRVQNAVFSIKPTKI